MNTPDASAVRVHVSSRRSACAMISSSSEMPAPNRSDAAAQPADRACGDLDHDRLPAPRRSSAWTGPSHSPIAAAASATRASIACCVAGGKREGVT